MTISGFTPKKRIILFGPPGAGKGTFTRVIKKFLPDIVHISTGDIFRENISKKTPLGVNAKSYIDKGQLVPDAITIALVEDRLKKEDVEQFGYILDGFPRTIEQARALSEITLPDMFLLMDPPTEILIQRIVGRYSCQRCGKIYNKYLLKPETEGVCDKCGSVLEIKQRADDTEEALKTRLDGYQKKSKAIIEYYEKQNVLKRVKKAFVLELTNDEVKELIDLLILNICVPIQVKSNDASEIEMLIKNVKKADPDYIEFRLDYIDDISNLTSGFLKKLVELSKDAGTKIIFTLRSLAEGGQMDISEQNKLKIIADAIVAGPDYIDVEMSSSDTLIREAVSLAIQNSVKVIFSYHDFNKTPSYDEARTIISEFEERLTQKLSIGAITTRDFPYKLIFTAQSFEDNLIPIRLCQVISEMRKNIISFCMGELGIFSRVSCVKYGSFFTFSSLGDKTAPGQISIYNMRDAHRILYKA